MTSTNGITPIQNIQYSTDNETFEINFERIDTREVLIVLGQKHFIGVDGTETLTKPFNIEKIKKDLRKKMSILNPFILN